MSVVEAGEQQYVPPKNKELSDDEKRRTKLVPGGLLKAELRSGGGDSRPSDGDQVIYHCTVRTVDGVVVQSTKKEFGGKGIPIRLVLGKSKMILGLLEGIPTMLRGEVAMFKMKPGMHYGEADCPVSAPDNFPKDDDLHFEIELIDFGKAKVIAEDFGVVKKVINEGQGWESPRAPYEVKTWISAKAGDGKLIVPRTEGEPFFFCFGNSEIPKGLEMGIGTMSRGEKAMIYVTSQYLTQSPFLPEVDGVEEVHFEVELVHFIQVRDVLGDGRLIKRRIHDGQGEFPMDCPLQDSQLRVHYKGMLLDEKKTVFYDTRVDNDGQPLEFSSGEGLVPEGFEMCVRLMLPGEIALVTCPPDYAYDKFPRQTNVPEGVYVQWEIELLGFEMPKDWTGLDFRSIMDEAEKIRSTGNRIFKEGKYELAKAKYEKLLREFNHVNPQDDDEGKEFGNARNMLHLNVAACYLKMGECRKSVEACNKVLDTNPVHVKALYRRGMAYMLAGDFEEARNDFDMMIKVDKSSEPDATAALQKLKQMEQESMRKAKKEFKGLFDKKPGEIADVDNSNKEQDIPEEIDASKSGIRNRRKQTGIPGEEDSDEGNLAKAGEPPAAGPRRAGWFSVRVSVSSTATVSTAPFYTFKSFRVRHLHHVRCMANPRRVKMVAKQIRRELSDMLLTDKNLQYAVLPETALGADRYLSSLTTISDVEVSADLQVVKVYVSIFGDERGRDVAIAGLKAKAKYVRSQLGKRMKLRLTPEIRFIEDESFERGSRVIAILDKIKSDNEKKNAKSQEKKEESPDLPSHDEDWDDDDADEDIIYVE